ncbi:MAG TPA: hypothetical protein VGD72_14510 [Mycobacteriales bacterium]|jgi:hypothetical protein
MDATTRVDLQRPSRWRDLVLYRLGERLFAEADADARRRGWDVTVRRRGLARTWRDPRLALLVPCPACAGAGCEDLGVPPCRTCRGTGRVVPEPRTALAASPGER